MELKDTVKIKEPDLEVKDEMLDENTVELLKELDYTGEVTQIQDGLIYVGFKSKEGRGWLTQVFKPEELELKE